MNSTRFGNAGRTPQPIGNSAAWLEEFRDCGFKHALIQEDIDELLEPIFDPLLSMPASLAAKEARRTHREICPTFRPHSVKAGLAEISDVNNI